MAMKRVTIYVDSDEWKGLQLYLLRASLLREKKISAGHYLMDLHRANFGLSDKPGKAVEPIVNKFGEMDEKTREMHRNGSYESFKSEEEDKLSVRAKYRLKNPTVMCPKCKNRNKGCVCGD